MWWLSREPLMAVQEPLMAVQGTAANQGRSFPMLWLSREPVQETSREPQFRTHLIC